MSRRHTHPPPLALVGIVLGLVYLVGVAANTPPQDGLTLLIGTRAWLSGRPLYTPHIESGQAVPNINLPHTMLLLVAFTPLPLMSAVWCWNAVNVFAFLAPLVAVKRALGGSWWIVAAIVLSSAVTHTQITMAQMSGVLAGLVSVAWLRARAEDNVGLGVALGTAVALKPFLGLLLLSLRNRPRACLIALATIASWFLVGVVVFGLGTYQEWLGTVTHLTWLGNPLNMSWPGWIARATAPGDFTVALWPNAAWAVSVSRLGSVVLIALTATLVCRSSNPDRGWVLAIVGGLLAGPTGWNYYGWVVAAPLWALVARGWRPPALTWALWVPWALLVIVPHPAWSATIGSSYAIGAFATYASVARDRRLAA